MKRGATLIEFIVVMAIIVTLVGIVLAAGKENDRKKDEGPAKVGLFDPELRTRVYEGHWFVLGTGFAIHHPDCPCDPKRAEADEQP